MTSDFSIIIPAYNEANTLPHTLSCLHEAMHKSGMYGEIIVVNNNSSDATARVAEEFGARVIFEPINQISRARNKGAQSANGEYLFFVDADTTIFAQGLSQALASMRSKQWCGGGSLVHFDKDIRSCISAGVWAWNWLSRMLHFASGCFLFCRKDAFFACKGFNEKLFAGEDVFFCRKLFRWGKSRRMGFILIDKSAATTSARKFNWHSLPYLAGAMALFLVFPPAIYSRFLCGLWYKRPM